MDIKTAPKAQCCFIQHPGPNELNDVCLPEGLKYKAQMVLVEEMSVEAHTVELILRIRVVQLA